MGDHQHTASGPRLAQCRLDRRFRPAVEGAGRLVEYEHAGVREQGPRQTHTLAFAARQFQPALADLCGVTVRQTADEVAKFGGLGRRLHVFAGRVRSRECDVRRQRVVEQRDILRHQRDGAPQPRELQVPHIHAVERDRAGLWIDQPQCQSDDGGLAPARRPHERDRTASFHVERHIGQPIRSGVMPEVDVAEPKSPALPRDRRRQVGGVISVGDVGCLLQKLRHLLQIDQRLADFPIGEAQYVQGRIERDQDQDGSRHIARPHATVRRFEA